MTNNTHHAQALRKLAAVMRELDITIVECGDSYGYPGLMIGEFTLIELGPRFTADDLGRRADEMEGRADRSHEECAGCALETLEPPRCHGHAPGPVSCGKFLPKSDDTQRTEGE